MYGEPGIVQQILFLLVPASVLGLIVGLGVFAGVYFAVTLALRALDEELQSSRFAERFRGDPGAVRPG